MHLKSVLQGKTSYIVNSKTYFMLLFHRAIVFNFADNLQNSVSVFQDINFDLVIWVMCFVCIGPLSYCTVPVCAAQLQQSRCSAHNQIPPRVLTMEDAYEVRIASVRSDNGRRLWSQDYAYASLISQCKQNAMRRQICKISWRNVHLKMCGKIDQFLGWWRPNKSNSDLRHGRYTK